MKTDLDPKSIGIVRKGLTEMSQSLCAMADNLEEPFKGTYMAVKKGFDDFLAALPPTDAVPAAMDANSFLQSLLSQMIGCSSLCVSMCSKIGEMKTEYANRLQTSVASALASGVETEITKRITEGKLFGPSELEVKLAAARIDLIPKTEAESLCSAARAAGITEGKTLAATEAQALAAQKAVIETRKTALSTASIALPLAEIDAMLGGTPEEFDARRTEVAARIEELKGLGVAYNSADPIWGRAWGTKESYEIFRSISIAAFKDREDVDVFATGRPRSQEKLPAMIG